MAADASGLVGSESVGTPGVAGSAPKRARRGLSDLLSGSAGPVTLDLPVAEPHAATIRGGGHRGNAGAAAGSRRRIGPRAGGAVGRDE
ncbi:hypothetical protein [Micromonospora sp. NPDC049662]|uniref:hypothetical protein n=1 Tax=Micromonospora sp. NPDC049662 TaxID=3155397 RepID=UPI00341C0C17